MSGSRQTRPLFYPVRQLNHICRVDAEEDVKDFRPLRPGLDPPEIVVLLLCPERAFHRSRPHSGKFLSDKVFLLFLLTERTASFHERCLYSVRLVVVPVFGSRVASISSDLFRIAPKQFLVHQGTSHEIWEPPITNERFSVPRHDSQEIRTGTLENIKKQRPTLLGQPQPLKIDTIFFWNFYLFDPIIFVDAGINLSVYAYSYKNHHQYIFYRFYIFPINLEFA